MRRIWKWGATGIATIAVAASVAYASVPGTHRALTPGLFDMHRASEAVYIDDQALSEQALEMVRQAEENVATFFGALNADPTYIICSTQACADRFGLRPRGLTLGYHIIIIGPGGLTELIFTHERLHAELHRFMGVSDIFDQRFPAWFDEGLASHMSGDTRLNRPENARDADWIRMAHSFRDWGRMHVHVPGKIRMVPPPVLWKSLRHRLAATGCCS